MSISTVVFYALSAMVLTFGALTVFSRKIFRAAVYLLLALISIAGIYFMMEVEFVAALQIIVYVGGIVVLIIFSIFLTQSSGELLPKAKRLRSIIGGLAAAAGLAITGWVITGTQFVGSQQPAIDHSAKNIGRQLLNYTEHGYVLPFEVVSILLLAALVGCIVIAMKTQKH